MQETTSEERLNQIESDVKTIQSDVKAMRDIVETWNNAKGFIITLSVLSKLAVWVGVSGAALTGIYHAIKHFGD